MNGEAQAAKVPLSFWIVSGLGLLWNAFGGYDYLMTKMRNMEYLASAAGSEANAQAMLAMIEGMPIWAHFLWGLGVWSSVAGSLLMLARSRHAVTAFLVSLVAAALSFAYQATLNMPPGLDSAMMKIMPLVILGAIAFLWWYCRNETAKGTLR
jgi:hypothetical protein